MPRDGTASITVSESTKDGYEAMKDGRTWDDLLADALAALTALEAEADDAPTAMDADAAPVADRADADHGDRVTVAKDDPEVAAELAAVNDRLRSLEAQIETVPRDTAETLEQAFR